MKVDVTSGVWIEMEFYLFYYSIDPGKQKTSKTFQGLIYALLALNNGF